MRVLGIDPGIRNTGWGVVSLSSGRLAHVANGVIQPNPKLADAKRLGAIRDGLAHAIKTHDPHLAAIEEIFVARSSASALKLGMARGVAMMLCGVDDIAVCEINPSQVKKSVVGTGRATKTQISAMVTRLLCVRAVNADAADALALAITAAHLVPAGVAGDAGGADGIGRRAPAPGLEAAINAALSAETRAASATPAPPATPARRASRGGAKA